MAGEGLECVLSAHVQHLASAWKHEFVESLKSFSRPVICVS